MKNKTQLFWLALGLAVASASQAGIVIRSASKDLASGKQTDNETLYAQNGVLRVDSVDEKGRVQQQTLLRDSAIWLVDLQNRSYRKLDKATLRQGTQRINDAMEKMKAQMADMPPERRAMMEQMMARMQGKGAAVASPKRVELTFVDTGKSEHVGQYTCRLWESKRGDSTKEQYCVVPTSSLPGGDELAATLRQSAEMLKDLTSDLPMVAGLSDHVNRFVKLNGYPVLIRHFSDGKPVSEELLKSIDKQAFPQEQFQVPKGFTERAMFGKSGSEGAQ